MKCRAASKVVKNQLNSGQRREMRKESINEFNKLLSLYNKQVLLQVCYVERFKNGHGQKWLEDFVREIKKMQDDILFRYEAMDEEVPDICEIKLRESGIDVDKLLEVE